MRVMRGLVLLLCCWVAGPSVVRAQTVLSWHREASAERCPERSEIVQAVRARSGISLQDEGARAERSLSAQLVAAKPGYHVLLKLRAADGRLLGARELTDESDDCRALGDAVVLTIGLMIGRDRAQRMRDESAPSSAPWQLALRAGALGSIGVLPSARVHGSLGARLASRRRRFALELAVAAFGSARIADGPRSARITPLLGSLNGCFGIAQGASVGLDACVGVQIGALRSSTTGFTARNREPSALFVAPLLRAPLGFHLSEQWQLVTAASIGVSTIRTRFEWSDAAGRRVELARTSRLLLTLELALQICL